ncbi:hypothetical protein BT69DRAFT_1353185 [Atractiella rhizophila]|nr:hypothetical protein BT69DRAFT_1353185 [Atractiella rhizophila]
MQPQHLSAAPSTPLAYRSMPSSTVATPTPTTSMGPPSFVPRPSTLSHAPLSAPQTRLPSRTPTASSTPIPSQRPIPHAQQQTTAQEDLLPPPSGAEQHQSVTALNDAALSAGVNLRREEEQIEESAGGSYKAYFEGRQEGWGRVRKQDWIEFNEVTKRVSAVAASFQLKNLEADSIPFIAMALKSRIRTVLQNAKKAEHHRQNVHHLAPPPVRKLKRKREEEEEIEKVVDEKEIVPIWEEDVVGEPGKVLETLERVEVERTERVLKKRLGDGMELDGEMPQEEEDEEERTLKDLREQLEERRSEQKALLGVKLMEDGSRHVWLGATRKDESGVMKPDAPTPMEEDDDNRDPAYAPSSLLDIQPLPACTWGGRNRITVDDLLWGMERENVSSFKKGSGQWRKEGRTETVARWQWGVGA